MKILITGSSGLIGTYLMPALLREGYEIFQLTRKNPGENFYWNPDKGKIQIASGYFDGVVHLAGENIGDGRWTTEKKAKIRYSRVRGTEILSKAIIELPNPPKVFLSASAIGYYGDRGDEILNENSPPGKGFLAGVCRDWENALIELSGKNIRVVNLRFGTIITNRGGALPRMLFPFKLGIGGIIGKGTQYMSVISLDDVIGAILYLLKNEMEGPVNIVSPESVTNKEFTNIFGKILSRPTLFPVPAFALRCAFGEMADELLLSSIRVKPEKLLLGDYKFKNSNVESILRSALK